MSDLTHETDPTVDEAATPMAEPVARSHGRHVADPTTHSPVPADTPDADSDPEIDEVRASEDRLSGNVEDEYRLRSMGAQPNPTEDDPGSYLNF